MKSKDQILLEQAYQSIIEKMILELLDTKALRPLEWKWNSFEECWETNFRVGGQKYGILLSNFGGLAWSPEELDYEEIDSEDWSLLKIKGTWALEFYQEGRDGNLRTGITGNTEGASKVFGIVGNAMVSLLKANPQTFKNLFFTAKEPSRIKLYKRLAPILAQKTNKRLFLNKTGSTFLLVDPSIKLSNNL